ncbi:AsnC family transcriptional regulator [Desulfohalobium retbaense]|uniref:siroheme decarboxylase n=1 Tax=Desulfohalobium retbaense (strain ATCC 49708 / DSM 5692 / JCM 16813 / HR100) TaxID=485915 RepID=C8X4L7_DESRD|nr:AsnC family transcriptional regulator [Desulfohalobium retbaense]ACV69240.1 putative transcriptional regulator, AsnC family [Desulfohalobium retbaense DSM 5692]
MDTTDRFILDIIQTGFPLVSRPYESIGQQVGLTEAETLARVRALKQNGVIRRIGANFHSRKLGWKSTLCAARVSDADFETFVAEVNRHPGVTHNYRRRHQYNVWFTLIAPSWEAIQATLEDITAATGVPILNLPAENMFKIKVDFPMQEETTASSQGGANSGEAP